MLKYKLSVPAKNDLEDIFDFGVLKFGNAQSLKYLEELEKIILLLSDNPEIGRSRNDIKQDLVCYSYKSHIIFYRIYAKHIRIIRVLYGGRDLVKFLK